MGALDDLIGIKKLFVGGVEQVTRQCWNIVSGATVVDNPTTGQLDISIIGGSVQSVMAKMPSSPSFQTTAGSYTTVWTASITVGGAGANFIRGRADIVATWNSPSPSGATIRIILDGAGSPFVDWPIPIDTAQGPFPLSFGFQTGALAPGVHTFAVQAKDFAPHDGGLAIHDSWSGVAPSAVLWLDEMRG